MALEVQIRKKLGDFQLDVAFAGEKETLALLGASGCGKSMTLKCIAGIETPDSGAIVLDGRVLYDSQRRINLAPQKRRVGYLFQQYALFPHMTVAQNIACGIPRRKSQGEAVAKYIASMQLSGMEGKYPRQLSGGQQQRVALARILANEPDVLLLDEPFSALDSYLRWQLELELTDVLSHYDRTTLFVSHNRDEVYRLCDRVCIINDGKSEPVVPVKALFNRPKTMSAALLSGCKNYSAAKRRDSGSVQAMDWGVSLAVVDDASEVDYIGVRAHFVTLAREKEGPNIIPCRVERIVEDVFSTIVMLRPAQAAPTANGSIRMEADKQSTAALKENQEVFIRIMLEDIMLLTKEASPCIARP